MPGLDEPRQKPNGVSQATWDRLMAASQVSAELVAKADEPKSAMRVAVIDLTDVAHPEIRLLGTWQGKWITAAQRLLRKSYERYKQQIWRKQKKESNE